MNSVAAEFLNKATAAGAIRPARRVNGHIVSLALQRYGVCRACEHVAGIRCTIQFPDAAHCRCRQWMADPGSRCPINKWGPTEVK